MVNKRNRIRLDKKDFFRAFLTDTAPSDVPIIFSNDGLYINSHVSKKDNPSNLEKVIQSFYLSVIEPEDISKKLKQSRPLKYKIAKNEISLRTLSLSHPRAQKNFIDFYNKYSDVITHLCSLSPFSIRAPKKIGNSMYSYDVDSSNKYKEFDIDTIQLELMRKNASSFFAYSGFNRQYKFYKDSEYIRLEKQFSKMWLLDVANCFDSIYTHTISWAIKNKEFIKGHVTFRNQFCQRFDTLIQRSNNNETNGIPIGAEVSRIFAEIIFQDIDVQILLKLINDYKYMHNTDYAIRRYVDDYIVFAKNDKIMKTVVSAINDGLNDYNLYLNDSKLEKYTRPFSTIKSNIIVELEELIKDFDKSLFYKDTFRKKSLLFPENLFNKNRFIHTYIDKVKKVCMGNKSGYHSVSSYLISTLSNRIIRLTNDTKFYPIAKKNDNKETIKIRDACCVLLDLIFFFYSVSPTVPASNKLAKIIIITDQFFNDKYPHYVPFIRTLIMQNIGQLSFEREDNESRDGYLSLEKLNIVLSTSEFGTNYLLPLYHFNQVLGNTDKLSYFDIISLLYYFKDHELYVDLKIKLEECASFKLDTLSDLSEDSEKAHLFLDLLTCPYVSQEFKENILKKYFLVCDKNVSKTPAQITSGVHLLTDTYWFVKWDGVDLLKLLERKELKSIY